MPTITEETPRPEHLETRRGARHQDVESGPPRRPGLGRLGRLGDLCARRRRMVLVAWGAVFVAGILLGGQVFAHLEESNGNSSSESVRGLELLNDVSTDGGSMVVVVDGAPVEDPAVEAAVAATARRIADVDGVTRVVTAYDDPSPTLRSPDGQASLILISTSQEGDSTAIERQLAEVRAVVADAVPGAVVEVGGDLAVEQDQMSTVASDLARGEGIAIPFLLLALLLVFRSFRAALIPVVAGLVTVASALLLLLGVTGLTAVSSYAVDVIALFGIALAVDYSLLMVNRYREERSAGHDVVGAIAGAVDAAGRTIAFSALTVIASLSGLFVFSDPTFTSLAIGGIATTIIALLAGLTLVPALLAVWGRKIKPQARAQADDGAFGRLARRVQRHPVMFALAASAALVAAGIPFLSANYAQDDPRTLPASFESRSVADTLTESFPAEQADPILVIGERSADDPAVAAYAEQVRAMPGIADVTVAEPLLDGISVTYVVPDGPGQGAEAQAAVSSLRADRASYPTYITGRAAVLMDFKDHIADRLPWALAWIALATFLLLFLMTGSVLVPIKALLMNVLSLGATFGALVWVFQDGHLSGLLGFEAFGAIEVWVPIVVFVFAFGLSMDYEVFLLSRIKECYDEYGDSDHAVATGLQRSGRIITSAAGLVMIVFLGFALGQNLGIKQMGLALAIAVAVDATVVRCILVPATMTLLGRANWWAPPTLRRLHARIGLRDAPAATVPATSPMTPPTTEKATS